MAGLHTLTITELATQLAQRACSAEEVVQELLTVIAARDPHVQGYLTVDAESALLQARAADQARARGASGRLLGVPLAIKDVLNVSGQPCTCASRILQGYVAPYDATAVARLRAAGAVFLGRTNMDEFAMGSSTEHSAYQRTRNPWNLECVPGGSSGGSAAVVAADEAIAALGTDTGGSIRQPAAFCGCVGLKPSYGRVSRNGLVAFASSLDQIGPMTKSVRDAALLFEIMAGYDPADSTSLDLPVPDCLGTLEREVRGLRAGVPREFFVEGLDPEVRRIVLAAVETLSRLGMEITEVSLPHAPLATATYYILAPAEASANLARFDGVRYGFRAREATDVMTMYCRTRAQGFGQEVKRRIILGTYVLSSGYYDAYYLRAQKVRTLIRRDFESVFQSCDVLLAPVTPTAAYRLGELQNDPLKMYLGDIYTVPVNLAGICGLSVPCGFTDAGLPVGLQIIGPALGEAVILQVGHTYEQATEWHRRRSPLRN